MGIAASPVNERAEGATASLPHVLIEEPHDIGLARIDVEPLDLDVELLPRKAPLDFRAAQLRRDARLRPLTHPAMLLRIAIPRAIDRHVRPTRIPRHTRCSAAQATDPQSKFTPIANNCSLFVLT